MNDDAPKVFISHASEDEPFARELATSLRSNGVNAWFDGWEILPGDKVIEKIFEKGVGQCDVFIIVLSKSSVGKPWVVEELDAALVKRIRQQTKIIPVRIDDCEVPVALQATAWTKIDPEEDYSTELHTLLSSIFELSAKPPLGERPPIFQSAQRVGKYDFDETHILEFMLTHMSEKGRYTITRSEFAKSLHAQPPSVVNDAIKLFESDGLITRQRATGTLPFKFQLVDIQPCAWIRYAPQILGIDTEQDVARVLAFVVSEGSVTNPSISEALDLIPLHVEMAVGHLESERCVTCLRAMSLPLTVTATALGRRRVRT